VNFEVTISEEGTVVDMTILESNPIGTFDAAARESVMKWRFLPKCTLRFARPFKTRSRVEFKLAEDPAGSDLYTVEQQLAVAPPDRKIVKSGVGFVIEAVDPCAKQ
jgi:TonB family protein